MFANLLRNCYIRALLKSPRRIPARQVVSKKVCLFKVDGFGDFIIALGALRLLTEHFGEENCVLVVFKGVVDLARREFPKATVIGISSNESGRKTLARLFTEDYKKLDAYKFDTLICLRHQRFLLHNLLVLRIRSDHFIGLQNSVEKSFENPFEAAFNDLISSSPKIEKFCGELNRHADLVGFVLKRRVAVEEILPRFSSLASSSGNYLVVSPFSSKTIKDYPSDQLLAVLQTVSSREGLPIFLCGGPAEKERLNEMHSVAKQKGIQNISVKQFGSFVDFCEFVAAGRAVLSMDTSTAHLAIALNKPTVVIIGGGHFGEFGPWQISERQIWLSNRLSCFHCDWKCIHPKTLCISEIPVNTVVDALSKVMQG